MKGRSIVKTKCKSRIKIIAIVLAVNIFLLCAALDFAGNFLFDFALDPNASFTMSDLFQGGDACASTEKEKLVVHEAAHGAAADTDPELYWDTAISFVGNYISE